MTQATNKPRFLVVDDNKGVQVLLQVLLGQEKCELHQASNGDEALAFLRAQPVTDLVILDLRMPRASGTKFLEGRELEPELKKIKVLLLSGDLSIDQVAKRFGITDFLEKGGNPNKLVEIVRRLVPSYDPPNLGAT